jgi:hypothetical protein
MKRSEEGKPKTPQTPRRSLTTSWDDIVAGRKLLKASFNAEDLSLLLDSIENGVAGTPPMRRFFRTSQAGMQVAIATSSSGHIATSASSGVVDTEMTPAYQPGGKENPAMAQPLDQAGLAKLEAEYEVLASSLHHEPQFFAPSFENPALFCGDRSSDALAPPAGLRMSSQIPIDGRSMPEIRTFEYPQAKGCTMMEVAPLPASSPVEGLFGVTPQWNLTARGREYLAMKPNSLLHGGNAFLLPSMPDTLPHSPETCRNPKCSHCVKLWNVSTSDGVKRTKTNQIKTYKCTYFECGKTFITRKEQQNHIARHSSEPKFYCEFPGCSCKYTTKSSLDLHVVRIHGDKKYKCDLCDERYSVRGDLNQHMKRKHNKSRKF